IPIASYWCVNSPCLQDVGTSARAGRGSGVFPKTLWLEKEKTKRFFRNNELEHSLSKPQVKYAKPSN
ncbi:hypothetical protein CWC03_08260, partial [Pseudoalteromonas sp. S2755]